MGSFEVYYDKYAQRFPDSSPLLSELKSLAEACFEKFSSLNAIHLMGWTPAFNDGEPCTHSREYMLFFNDAIIGDAGMCLDMVKDEFLYMKDISQLDDFPVGSHSVNLKEISPGVTDPGLITFGNRKDHNYGELVTLIDSQPLADQIWGTNYSVLITRDGSSIKLEHQDYDCGW